MGHWAWGMGHGAWGMGHGALGTLLLPLPPLPTPHSPARLEIADTEKRESRTCRTQLLQKSVKASLTA